jgi:hypothetical protein
MMKNGTPTGIGSKRRGSDFTQPFSFIGAGDLKNTEKHGEWCNNHLCIHIPEINVNILQWIFQLKKKITERLLIKLYSFLSFPDKQSEE